MDIKSSIDTEIFHPHADLSPLLWDENGDIRPELLPKLMTLAQAYIEFCKIPKGVKVRDITLTGSLSGFNYTKYSDLDIHIIIDYNDIPASEELVTNYFMMKKDMWSDEFDLKFFTYPIEMYVQNLSQYRAGTSPQYSIQNQTWVHDPVKPIDDFDETTVMKKSKDIMHQVTELEDEVFNDPSFDSESAIEELNELKDKIKSMRVAAIKKSGDFGTGNLVFKVLRNSGFLERITNLKKYIIEKNLSIQN